MISLLESTPVNKPYIFLYLRRFVRASYDWKGTQITKLLRSDSSRGRLEYELNQIVKLLPNF